MKYLLTLAWLASIQLAHASNEAFTFKEKMSLESGSFRGKAILTLKHTTLIRGKKFTADIRFYNSSGGDKFYNPFFNRLIPLPATLAIFDSSKTYIGDLFANFSGSRRTVDSETDWVHIESLAYVGKEYSLTTGLMPGTKYGTMTTLMPPGKYYLQVIYDKSFVSRGYHGELFRSNVVQIEIVDRH